ncbi:alpha/beta-Hydrolases superfamily protein [Perilla frutescens var. frutescens]|nr:alpha/beta-Hydrolases superfamily protein [Perilla frutescens var. frutescens]
MGGRLLNEILSMIVFTVLDLLDFILCYAFKIADFLMEAEWKPCYCSSAEQDSAAVSCSGGAEILVSEEGESKKIVRLTRTKLHLEEISDTLYTRKSKMNMNYSSKIIGRRPSFTVNSTVVEMLQGRIGKHQMLPTPRWSDCDCSTCTSWTSSCKETLFVKADGAKDMDDAPEDVVFIHGFISSSSFWSETLYPNFSKSAKSKYRFLAVDLLGFGRSPKPNDSLYTLREHLEMIETSVLDAYKPYFPAPKGEVPAQYTMRRIAPRRVWPVIAFGASIGCWYEHISRTACLVLSKHHRLWEFLTKLLTRNRIRTYLIEGFFTHTHNAAWHTLHNIICGSAGKVEGYLEEVKNEVKCNITIFHGKDDELIPVECSYNMQSRIPRAQVKVVENKDHLTIVVGRQKAFARELEEIWNNANV